VLRGVAVVVAAGWVGCSTTSAVEPPAGPQLDRDTGQVEEDAGPSSTLPEATPDADGDETSLQPEVMTDAPANDADAPSETDASDWQSCSGPGDCLLAARGCCGGFYTPETYAAIGRDKLQAWNKAVCPNPGVSSCDASLIANDRLFAFCIAGRCQEIVVPTDPISACTGNLDCVSVSGRCDGECTFPLSSPFAIRVDQFSTYLAQVCPGVDAASLRLACEGPDAGPEAGIRTTCGADGHCKAQFP
jgi:hypothetical protein